MHEKQRQLLSGLPEFCVKDMASWFRFVVLYRPALLQGLQVHSKSWCWGVACVCVCVPRIEEFSIQGIFHLVRGSSCPHCEGFHSIEATPSAILLFN